MMTVPDLEMDADPFRYGRRQIIRYDKTGQPSYRWEPLQPADFLNPQSDDEFAHGPAHDQAVPRLRRYFRYHHRYNPSTLVISGLPVCWPGLALSPAPDLAVIPQVHDHERVRTRFDVAAEGVGPRFVLEVTSPNFAEFDRVDKLALYAQAGVAEYFILDLVSTADQPTPRLVGYHLEEGRYLSIAPDAEGRLHSAVNRLWLRLTQDGDVSLIDERSGRPVEPDATYEEPTSAAFAEAAFRASSIAAQLGLLGSGE
jgi:colicin import membrane protein